MNGAVDNSANGGRVRKTRCPGRNARIVERYGVDSLPAPLRRTAAAAWRELRRGLLADRESLEAPRERRVYSAASDIPPAAAAVLALAVSNALAAAGGRAERAKRIEAQARRRWARRRIADEFNGRNYRALAVRYRLSERSVRRIVDRRKK